ncbi:DsbA family protein [Kribbella deserti]|uniref:DsbA family protein n=1 Tax=Kribbella deserti TaxID=1926257 RepID=A0ABV6QLX5_9ACTN
MSKSRKAELLTPPKKRRITPGVVVLVVLLLVLAGGVGVQYWRSNSGVSVENADAPEPAVITGPGTDGQGVTFGKADAKTTIEVYLDFRCPHCKEFEDEAGEAINKYIDEGRAKVTYWPMDFVSKDNSPRIANAWGCAAAQGKARSYSDEIFRSFEKSWTEEQLLALGKALKIDNADFNKCVTENGQAKWIESIQTASQQRGIESTPTVFVNGKKIDASAQALQVAVAAAS